jgi:hypothetical protein
VARALTACGCFANDDREKGGAYFAEAAGLARGIGDSWWLGQILFLEAIFSVIFGELAVAEATAEEGHRIADNIGASRFSRRYPLSCRNRRSRSAPCGRRRNTSRSRARVSLGLPAIQHPGRSLVLGVH